MRAAPKPSLALQLGYASWGGPVIAAVVGSMASQKMNEVGPYVKIGVGLLMLAFVVAGFFCGLAGLFLAKRDPENRTRILRHSIAGVMVSGFFTVIFVCGALAAFGEDRTNAKAMQHLEAVTSADSFRGQPGPERYRALASLLRETANESRGVQRENVGILASGMESLLAPLDAHMRGWSEFAAAGGIGVATLTGSPAAVRERQEVLARAVTATRFWKMQLAAVQKSWGTIQDASVRDAFVQNVAGASIRDAEKDLELAGHMKSVLDVLERGHWRFEGEGVDFTDDADADAYNASVQAMQSLAASPSPAD